MNTTTLRTGTLLIATAAALALSACGRNEEQTAGQKLDATVAKTEQAAAEVKSDIQREATEAKSSMQQGAAEVKADASAAAEKAKAAVSDAATKTGNAAERMTEKVGETLSDASITASVNAELAKDKALSAIRINVDTSNGRVLLKGTAPTRDARDRATVLAKSVKGVTAVDNQLEVRG